MKMNNIAWVLFALIALLSACEKESLEDTYKDYAGDGEIRYIGKCTDLLVQPGWKRIIVTWKNNTDPLIKKVKVKWGIDANKDSVLLARGTTEYSITTLNGKELEDGNYEISVCGVDTSGHSSITNPVFGRPYTYDHEDIRAFNRLVSNIYIVQDRLILCFVGWQENMKEAKLTYTQKDGTPGELVLTPEIVDDLYYMVPGEIDPAKPIDLHRKGEIAGCKDIIDFEPYSFTTDKTYEADFKQEMKRQFGYDEVIPDSWANSVETLYLDWSIGSFIDLLNLPNLKKLVLGSRRYILPTEVADTLYGQSVVTDKIASDFALKVLHELNGLTVERYNKHFRNITEADFIHEKGEPQDEPEIVPLDMTGLRFTSWPEDDEAYHSGLEYLTDGNDDTCWEPIYLPGYLTYELMIDLKSQRTLNGLRFVQKKYTRNGEISIAPEMIKIKVSNNLSWWEDATYVEENTVGKSNGEINYISFSEKVKESQYQYVKILINAGSYANYYYSSAAEITLY